MLQRSLMVVLKLLQMNIQTLPPRRSWLGKEYHEEHSLNLERQRRSVHSRRSRHPSRRRKRLQRYSGWNSKAFTTKGGQVNIEIIIKVIHSISLCLVFIGKSDYWFKIQIRKCRTRLFNSSRTEICKMEEEENVKEEESTVCSHLFKILRVKH